MHNSPPLFDARRVQLEEGPRLIQLGESKQKTNFQRVESRLGLKLDWAPLTVGLPPRLKMLYGLVYSPPKAAGINPVLPRDGLVDRPALVWRRR
jgi:hypothetical protein